MVYGEIVHNRLYECAENIEIAVDNGEIYDYKTNKWGSKLLLDSLSSGQDKTWHIKKPRQQGTSQHESMIKISCGAEQHDPFNQECAPMYPDKEIDKNVEKYWWRQRTQELMNDVSNFIQEETRFGQQNDRRSIRANLEPPIAPPPSPLVRSSNIEHSGVVIDAASHEQWEVVWTMLDAKPSIIDKRPPLRRFCLIHVAAFQGDASAVTNLLGRGASASILTDDGLSARDIAQMNNYHSIVEALARHEDTGSGMERVPRFLAKILNEFMVSMKTYMEGNGLEEDPFMENLCDDIHVATRSLNSNLGSMYLGARVLSQGGQRAYNLTNLTLMDRPDDDGGYPGPPQLRHAMSQNPNSVYASPQTMDMMDALSTPPPVRMLRQMSSENAETLIDPWESPHTLGGQSTQSESDLDL
jgi:hypothetical protein